MNLTNNKIKLFINDTLESMDCFIKKPFIVFESSNFLDEESYTLLKNELYDFAEFDHIFSDNGNKKKFTIGGYNINILKDGSFKDFCELILSKRFFHWFKKTHLPAFKDKKYQIKIRNPRSRLIRLYKLLTSIFFIPLDFYYAEIEYSSMKKGSFIPPHTDDPNKRLSFVYYIPFDDLQHEYRINLGTVFWQSDLKQKSNEEYHHIKAEKVSQFEKENSIFHIATYDSNKIVGFIPCDNSWHSVKENKSDIDRRVVVINYYKM